MPGLTEQFIQSYSAHLAKPLPPNRLDDIGLAAVRVFRRKGYRRALMTDVARELELAPGTLYRHVEGKEALFQLALLFAMTGHVEADQSELPLRTPLRSETLALVEKWLAEEASFPRLRAANERRAAPGAVEAEL